MKICRSVIILLLVICPVCGFPLKIKSETIKNFNKRTGEATAVDHLIWEYEREHKKLYNKEIRDGTLLHWPDLEYKNLSNYCRKYLQHAVPTRIMDDATGTKIENELHYVKENTNRNSKIVIVQCKIYLNHYKPRSYYITRAAKPDCVYALNRTKYGKYSIINRHCEFDVKLLINKCLKGNRIEIMSRKDPKTGQLIAKDEYLLEYELEHLDLFKKESKDGKHIEWPHAMRHENLDIYCHQYLKECCPRRNRVGVTGTWHTQKFYYQKFSTNIDVSVTTIKCVTSGSTKVHYRMTRAPETNCVYILLRKDGKAHDPLVIAFKHCDFEESKDHHTNIHDKEVHDTINEKKWYQSINYIEDKPLINWPLKKKKVKITVKRHHHTGQPIAEDKYLLDYELEHQELLKTVDDSIKSKRIEWPWAMAHGNLDSYCYQYMREAVLNRNRLGVTGSWKIDKLHYRKMNTVDDIEVITVICKTHNASKLNYYMTRAPQPNCVYALLRHGYNVYAPLVIVFKHCDFEYPNNQQAISKDYVLSLNVSPKEEVKEEAIDMYQTLQLFAKY